MIHVNHIHVGERLLPLSFTCQPGEVLHVVGPNGSGKSTLLNAIAGMISYQGEVVIDGIPTEQLPLTELALYRAFLAQSQRPAFNLDVFQYLALSIPHSVSVHDANVAAAVQELADLMSISDKLHRSIHELSGGEWQRVRLVGSCLQVWPRLNDKARLLLLDEPSAPLDIAQEAMLYKLIDYMKQKGLSIIVATHDLNRTLRHADRVLLLKQGVLQESGIPSDVLTEENLARVFQTRVKSVDFDGKSLLLFE